MASCGLVADVVRGGMSRRSRGDSKANVEDTSTGVEGGSCAAADRTCGGYQSQLQRQVECRCFVVEKLARPSDAERRLGVG